MLSDAKREAERASHEARVAAALAESRSKEAGIELVEGGFVAPLTKLSFGTNGMPGTFDGGVYYSDGRICDRARHLKNDFQNQPVPCTNLEITGDLAGCHLFGGMLKNEHFGHFIIESLARLWAASLVAHASIVFYLRIPKAAVPAYVWQVFSLLLPGRSITILDRPTAVEKLWVPDQIAHPRNGLIYGHPFIREMFAAWRAIPGKGFERIYVSRSKLQNVGGEILAETLLERELAKEGYVVIYPEHHPIEEQLGIYNGARELIFSEGSALHLYAMIAAPHQRVYIVRRRRYSMVFDWQIMSFGGGPVAGSLCLEAYFIPASDGKAWSRSRIMLDFAALKNDLQTTGFISGRHWTTPTDAELAARLEESARGLESPLIRHPF